MIGLMIVLSLVISIIVSLKIIVEWFSEKKNLMVRGWCLLFISLWVVLLMVVMWLVLNVCCKFSVYVVSLMLMLNVLLFKLSCVGFIKSVMVS